MAYEQGRPAIVLKETTVRRSKEEAYENNIVASLVIGEVVRTAYGPRGLNKLLVGTVGDITVTKTGVTILSEASIEHPVGKIIIDAAKALEKEIGDGTTSLILLTCDLVRNAYSLYKQGISPITIVRGYNKALSDALEKLAKDAKPVDLSDREALNRIAETAVTFFSSPEERRRIAEIVLSTAERIVEKRDGGYYADIDWVSIVRKRGHEVLDSRLINGVIVDKEVVHPNMSKTVRDARIALIDYALEVKKTEISTEIEVKTTEELRGFIREEEEMIREKVDRIVKSGANVVFCQKGIDELAQQYLYKNGITAVRRVKRSDMERLERATYGKIVSDPEDISEEKLGRADVVREEVFENEKIVFVEGCREPKAVSILLRSVNEDLLKEYEREFKHALSAVLSLYKDPRYVVGGGAELLEIGMALRRSADNQSEEDRLVYEAFAESVESLVRTLATNVGMKSLTTMSLLKSKHSKNGSGYGIEAVSRQVADLDGKVVDPYLVVKSWLVSAVELATTIIGVDEVILTVKPKTEEKS
ncbi:MAG: thermosome subunit [Candidatus Brockarchaeota archaeon]|nr:thermosome subunit [Candidatus Brockarchaeota archaeon]MBO3808631.1 thermosome subunit [Candidatus Brockarchaeota archaeon]